MAFHGNRGTSRNRGSGSGFSRGRGGGSSGPRGRGRGRGGFGRGRGKPVFDSVRVAETEEKAESGDGESSIGQVEDKESSDYEPSEDDDIDEALTARPYLALLQNLAADAAPEAKRRRLSKDGAHEKIQKEAEDEQDKEPEEVDVDNVEEPEEGPETAIDGLDGEYADEDDVGDASDPFENHFADPDDKTLARRLKSLQGNQWSTQKSSFSELAKAVISIPEEKISVEAIIPAPVSGPASLKLKQKLAHSISKQRPTFDTLEKSIAPFVFNYQDLFFSERSPTNAESLRRLTCLHAVNHIFKTRDRVIKNNARLSREENNDSLDLRDQGFTRPKVLMVLPTRESCVRMVNMIVSLCEPEQQENRKRFDESYVDKEDKFSGEKAEDFRELFSGNDDDMFRLGMKFTRKTVKYFSQFYNSDIIIASPLGLRMAVGAEGDKKVDHDFLSSIEIAIVDQAEALLMQNWEHMEFIFEHLNLQPKEAHGCDFSRVRSWYLDNNAKYFRQTIAMAAFNTPELNTLFYNHSKNWAGKIKIGSIYVGALQELGLKVKQTFSRIESPSFSTDPDTRFTYFTTTIIPTLTRHSADIAGTVIFIPSYLDFVRVRNYFSTSPSTSSLSFGNISEYTSVREVARARSHFYTGRHSILLYTERAHHFRRYQLKGVRKVVMYGLPDNPIFYKEIADGYLNRSVQEGRLEPGEGAVRVLFSKWDVMKLERVAGTERVGKMIREKGDTFDFI